MELFLQFLISIIIPMISIIMPTRTVEQLNQVIYVTPCPFNIQEARTASVKKLQAKFITDLFEYDLTARIGILGEFIDGGVNIYFSLAQRTFDLGADIKINCLNISNFSLSTGLAYDVSYYM